VTNTEYTAFLNAIAKTDTNGTYATLMGSNVRGGITRSGASPNFVYTVRTNMGDKPVIYVSWLDALRYVNWLHNGKPTGAQGTTTTENGVYTVSLGTGATRIAGARFFLPTSTDWARAAYHDVPASTDWTYPTRTSTTPTGATAGSTGTVSNPGANVVNYNDTADWASQNGHVTKVGSCGLASASGYGTYDQGGNVREWTETARARCDLRGGSWDSNSATLQSSSAPTTTATTEENVTGFRVARSITCTSCDDDGDGVVNSSDCAPLDPASSTAAAEVTNVTVDGKGPTTIAWTAQAAGFRYDVASGYVLLLRPDGGVASGACMADSVATATASDARPNPPLGNGYYYIVRSQNACGAGTYGTSKAGVPRQPTSACPLPAWRHESARPPAFEKVGNVGLRNGSRGAGADSSKFPGVTLSSGVSHRVS
jgi:formylglycine-generating enzyme required for sulfatase activity